MTDGVPRRPDAGRARARRHRRERQIIVFGLLIIAVAFTGVFAAGVYKSDIDGPFSRAFVTPAGAFDSDIDLVCPPPSSYPLPADQVGIRVLNGTTASGLATSALTSLEARGFVGVAVGNWTRTYGDTVRIVFGPDGVQQAYTVARHFAEAELVLDTREGTLVDVILGDSFADDPNLREAIAPELAEDLQLSANAECLPASLITAEPAPRDLPRNPLDPEPSPSPSPSS